MSSRSSGPGGARIGRGHPAAPGGAGNDAVPGGAADGTATAAATAAEAPARATDPRLRNHFFPRHDDASAEMTIENIRGWHLEVQVSARVVPAVGGRLVGVQRGGRSPLGLFARPLASLSRLVVGLSLGRPSFSQCSLGSVVVIRARSFRRLHLERELQRAITPRRRQIKSRTDGAGGRQRGLPLPRRCSSTRALPPPSDPGVTTIPRPRTAGRARATCAER